MFAKEWGQNRYALRNSRFCFTRIKPQDVTLGCDFRFPEDGGGWQTDKKGMGRQEDKKFRGKAQTCGSCPKMGNGEPGQGRDRGMVCQQSLTAVHTELRLEPTLSAHSVTSRLKQRPRDNAGPLLPRDWFVISAQCRVLQLHHPR